MGVVDRKQELFENVVRLRRVGRRLGADSDLASVRLALEAELGSTVSLRLAARLLGVSHTALQRWVVAGDVPLVITFAGRTEVPVPALLDLYEEIHGARSGQPGRYALAPAIKRRRQAAQQMRVHSPASRSDDGHDRARQRGLAYHAAIADQLTKAMVAEAQHVLFRWRQEGRIDARYARRWEELLVLPLPGIRQAIIADDSEADDLRQSSPFAGMLSEPQRRRILAEVR